jgi:CxxC motif-containing protein (DUF1111 family)
MVMRISVPEGPRIAEIEEYIFTSPDPTYRGQIQDFSVAGHAAKAIIAVSYTEELIVLSGRETTRLRSPTYTLENLGHGPLPPEAMVSPRVAPQMIGLRLLKAIPTEDIIAQADRRDLDSDGISGCVQVVMSAEHGVPMLGRFSLKAGQPLIREQSATAFRGDIGLSTPLHPAGFGDCTDRQQACRATPAGNTPAHGHVEISDEAEASRQRMIEMQPEDRAAPIRFLDSL